MSSLDGTEPITYEEELSDHYDPDRYVNLSIPEKDVHRLLDFWMEDIREVPHNHPVSEIIFSLIGKSREAMSEMEERVRKKAEAAAKRKAKAEAKPKAKTKPKARRKAATKPVPEAEPAVEAAT